MRQSESDTELVEQTLLTQSPDETNALSKLKDNQPYKLRDVRTLLSDAAKDRVREEAGLKCWLCVGYGNEVAHVIAKADDHLFAIYRQNGLHNMSNVNAHENLMCPCPNCHKAYDKTTPVWVFLPLNLAEFLEAEKQFQTERIFAAKNGKKHRRKPVTKVSQRQYARYQVVPGFIPTEKFREAPVKQWSGNPFAAIFHSARIAGNERLHATKHCGIPDDVANIFNELRILFETPAPEILEKRKATETVTPVVASNTAAKDKIIVVIKSRAKKKGQSQKGLKKADTSSVVTSGAIVNSTGTIPIIERLRRSEKRPAQQIEEDTSDSGSTCDNDSNASPQTVHSYNTRSSKYVTRYKQRKLAFAKVGGPSGIDEEVGYTLQVEQEKKDVYVEGWLKGTKEKRATG